MVLLTLEDRDTPDRDSSIVDGCRFMHRYLQPARAVPGGQGSRHSQAPVEPNLRLRRGGLRKIT